MLKFYSLLQLAKIRVSETNQWGNHQLCLPYKPTE